MSGVTVYVEIASSKGSQSLCHVCHQTCPTYDHLYERHYRFVPLWGYTVIFIYRPRRVNCSKHGIAVEYVPWSDGKSPISKPFQIFLSHWAKHLSWKEVANQFKVSWRNVFESVKHVVKDGLKHRDIENVRAIGIDFI